MNFKNVNWFEFRIKFHALFSNIKIPINKNLESAEIDKYVEYITDAIKITDKQCIPKQKVTNHNSIVLNDRIIATIKFKNSLRKKLFKNPFSPIRNLLKSQIFNLNIYND